MAAKPKVTQKRRVIAVQQLAPTPKKIPLKGLRHRFDAIESKIREQETLIENKNGIQKLQA